jgi:hypothetical protein
VYGEPNRKENAMSFHRLTLRLGAHTVLVVYNASGEGGTYCPVLNFYLSGPNGSIAGTGPKPWPRFLARFDASRRYNDRFRGGYRPERALTLRLYVPHVSFATGYRLRRFGGLVAYRACQKALYR